MRLTWLKIHLILDALILCFISLNYLHSYNFDPPASHDSYYDYDYYEGYLREEEWELSDQDWYLEQHYLDEYYYEPEQEPNIPDVVPTALQFAIVADLDIHSKDPDNLIWRSFITKGILTKLDNGKYTIEWQDTQILNSSTATNNRSMELSELVKWQENLLAFCDYTGMVYKISDSGQVFQRHTLADGNGKEPKAFKTEWVTEKDGHLYVGSIGKEWVVKGKVTHHNAEWIKVIDGCGTVENINWSDQYNFLRRHTNTTYPGYLIHEAVVFNKKLRKWIFLPRKVSQGPYDPVQEERMGSNIMLIADEEFSEIEIKTVGQLDRDWGYSSVKIIPYTNDLMALRVYEVSGITKTTITVFDMEGNILLEPEPFVMVSESVKYEGLEFL